MDRLEIKKRKYRQLHNIKWYPVTRCIVGVSRVQQLNFEHIVIFIKYYNPIQVVEMG